MRLFEIMLILFMTASFALPLALRRVERWMLLVDASIILLLIIHLFIEKYRWQMVPLYVLAVLVGLAALFGPATSAGLGRWRAAGSIAGLIVLIPATALPYLFPVPMVPEPTGEYPVGTFSIMLTDEDRKELYSTNPDEPRMIMVQAWYPAKAVAGSLTAPWVDHPEIVAPAISRWLGYPDFFLDHVSLAKSHSLLDAPVADSPEPFPVITFSHGWNGIRQQSTFLMEELASWGYVVVSIDHAYGAQVVAFEDGRVAENNSRALPSGAPPDILEPAADILGDQWAGDIGFVLDTLVKFNEIDPQFAGKLDLSKVGVSGHSTGGGAAVEFCGRDERCKVLLGLDVYLTPVSEAVLTTGISTPALLLFSEAWPDEKNNALLARLMTNSPLTLEASIMGTGHYDFTDLPLLTPLASALGFKGPLKGETALAIIRAEAVAILDEALRGGDAGAVRGLADQFAELKFDYLP